MSDITCYLSNRFFMTATKTLIAAVVNQAIIDYLRLQEEIENTDPNTYRYIYKKRKQSEIEGFLDSDMVYSITGLHGNSIIKKCLNGEFRVEMFEYCR